MGELIAPLEIIGGLLLLFGLIICSLIVRRRLLGRNNATTFDCSLRHDLPRKPGGWILGVARYDGDQLEWFRVFSLYPRPSFVLQRTRLDLIEGRQPTDDEIDAILPESVVARCSYDKDVFELAMSRNDYTGFTTWLESAPPGIAPFTS